MGIKGTKETKDAGGKNRVEEDYWIEEKDELEEWRNWKSDRNRMKVEG